MRTTYVCTRKKRRRLIGKVLSLDCEVYPWRVANAAPLKRVPPVLLQVAPMSGLQAVKRRGGGGGIAWFIALSGARLYLKIANF